MVDRQAPLELPPHTRRRVTGRMACTNSARTTSAYAEKRLQHQRPHTTHRNYLRIRGEENPQLKIYALGAELPPHTRRRGFAAATVTASFGTTSAYAEKSRKRDRTNARWWNYLRIRGEERNLPVQHRQHKELPPHTRRRAQIDTIRPTLWELPPHTRRRGVPRAGRGHPGGTTSAYAEKSSIQLGKWRRGGNYLRIRGEEHLLPALKPCVGELPPHTRRRDFDAVEDAIRQGTTSAYAEKSW